MKKLIILLGLLAIASVGYAQQQYEIVPKYYDHDTRDGFMDPGTHSNPYIIKPNPLNKKPSHVDPWGGYNQSLEVMRDAAELRQQELELRERQRDLERKQLERSGGGGRGLREILEEMAKDNVFKPMTEEEQRKLMENQRKLDEKCQGEIQQGVLSEQCKERLEFEYKLKKRLDAFSP